MKKELLALSLGLLVGTALTFPAAAQEVTGTPGSPDATTTIDGTSNSTAAARVRRQDRTERGGINALLARAHRAA